MLSICRSSQEFRRGFSFFSEYSSLARVILDTCLYLPSSISPGPSLSHVNSSTSRFHVVETVAYQSPAPTQVSICGPNTSHASHSNIQLPFSASRSVFRSTADHPPTSRKRGIGFVEYSISNSNTTAQTAIKFLTSNSGQPGKSQRDPSGFSRSLVSAPFCLLFSVFGFSLS